MAKYPKSTPPLPPFRGPESVAQDLAQRLRALRLARRWTRRTLAERSGVSEGSLKRFENTAQVSLENLLKLCGALGRLGDFDDLLQPPPARSIADLERRAEAPSRQRGSV